MNQYNKAIKEIEESVALVEYLLHYNLDFNNIANFKSSVVKKAVEWKKNQY